LATLQQGCKAIRELKRQQGGQLKQPVTLLVRGGTYYLDQPIAITPEDSGTAESPVTFAAFPNEAPIISGGKRITQWEKFSDKLWKANLPEVKAGKWYFRLLRSGDEWATRARYPQFDSQQPLTGGWLYAQGTDKAFKPKAGVRDRILVDPQKFPQWENWEGAEVHIFPAESWVNTVLKVNRVDKENHTLFVQCEQDIQPGNRFFITNAAEALDSEGEWYLDAKAGELIYWATQPDFPEVEVVAPVIDRLFVLQGNHKTKRFVEHIHFRGLTFTDTNYKIEAYYTPSDAAIWMIAARSCLVEGCNFRHLGGYAIRLEQLSSDNEIIDNTMAELGQGGVVLLGNTDTQPVNNLIAANDIHDCGKIYKHVAGVYLNTGSDNRIIHNRIQRMPRYGISLKSGHDQHFSHNNLVEFNEVLDTNLETNDTGAIETLGRDRLLSGNIIRFNWIRNVVGMGTTPEGEILTPYKASGVFLDDNSSGTTIYGNVIVGPMEGAVTFSNGKENQFENNIFINANKHQINLLQRDDFMRGNIFRRNIVVFSNPQADLWKSWARTWKREPLAECDFNLYWNTGGLDLANTEQTLTPEGNFAQWQAAGFDRNSLITDPKFVNPQADDFRLQPDSPALKLGFKPIPLERMGIKGFSRT